MKASVSFNEGRKEMLKDPELVAMYLEESLQEGDMEEFKQALKHVAEARSTIHENTDTSRRNPRR